MKTISFPEIATHEIAIRLALAGLFGAAVGLEREWRERAAGLRTHILVSVGAASLTILSAYGWHDFYNHLEVGSTVPIKDPARIAAQIVSGIGFLGGGVILRSGLNVRGLTTAASIWAVGAIGMAAGAGMYMLGLFTTVGVLVALIVLRYVSSHVKGRYHPIGARLALRVGNLDALTAVTECVEGQSHEISSISIDTDEDRRSRHKIVMEVVLHAKTNKVELGQQLAALPLVERVTVSDEN